MKARASFPILVVLLGAACSSTPTSVDASSPPCPTDDASMDVAYAPDGGDADVSDGGPSCENPAMPAAKTDPDYRVTIQNVKGPAVTFPPPTQSWQLRYQFTVPPLPCSSNWNHANETFYLWGDVDFDTYGAAGAYPLHHYRYNQIVPQIMVGSVLAGNDSAYAPSFSTFDGWVMQAQYYWQDKSGTNYALTGKVVPVHVGDLVTTEIDYFASNGEILAQIATASGMSSVKIPKPFPNDTLYTSWTSFFTAAQAASTNLLGNPVINVESHDADQATVCSILPFVVEEFSVPGTFTASQLLVSPYGGLTCTPKLATLGF